MKEININIEGYNVNGICVGCLNYNRKMQYDIDIKEILKRIGDIDIPEELSIQMCWECLAAVKSVKKFQEQLLRSYNVLIEYSHKHPFLDTPEDLSMHASINISTCNLAAFDSTDTSDYTPQDVKEEKAELVTYNEEFDVIKEEQVHEPSELKDEECLDDFHSQDVSQDGDYLSSDEDIQLSKLKRKKEKKEVKLKKKLKKKHVSPRQSRKLKNLPTDIAELYTMDEEEMWIIRAQDVSDETFQKLKYKCSNCILIFNTEKSQNLHMEGKHDPVEKSDKHQCDVCKGYFISKDNLTVHRSLHLSAYRCTQCGLITTLKRLLLKHACAENAQIYKCADCDKSFSSKSKLTYHKNVCHQEKPQCDCCGKVFANKVTLKNHLKVNPQNKEEKEKEKLYITCKGCNKVFHSRKSYRSHVVIHDGLSYPCLICGKLFQWKRNLSRHIRAHREKETGTLHECRQCGKTFASRDCYKNHMKLSKMHAEPDTYTHECNYCGKKFATKWCMVDHIDWDHLKRVKYQCSVCFKAFKTAKIMVAHMNNIHEGKKRETEGEHLCDICGKSYKTVKRLKGHVWAMHTQRSNTKNYKCKLCSATFLWQTSIYKHVRMMHGNTRNKPSRAPAVKKQDSYVEIFFHQDPTSGQGGAMPLPHPVPVVPNGL